ncbi:MAG: hypothetical protein COB15_10350 [Flavobacteriales bacterium]|nr:MAG: hypothetical protein COB15_10350 [Flavobacteriales bacterium]
MRSKKYTFYFIFIHLNQTKKTIPMTIKLITSLIAFTLLFSVSAQDKKTSFQIEKGESILSLININEQGFIIKTGKNSNNSKKVNWKLKYFDLDLNLIWDKAIPKEIVDQRYYDQFFSNIKGSKIYHIEKLNKPSGNLIQQISKEGLIKKHQINKSTWQSLSKKGNYKHTFSNENFMCFLFSKDGNENHPKKKIEEKLILYTINSSDFSENTKTLELPKIKTDPIKTNFWSYKSHDEDNLFFANIFKDKSEKRTSDAEINIAKLNYNGQLKKDINLVIKRENIAKVNQIDSKVDIKNEHVYVFGMEQLKLNVKENDKRNLFIIQYDFDGNLLWENKIEGISAGNGYFNFNVLIQKNKSPHLELKARNLRATWEFTPDGKFIEAYSTNLTEVVRINGSFIPNEGSSNFEYFKNCRSREHQYYSRILTKSEDKGVLIEHNDETGQVDVLLFSK